MDKEKLFLLYDNTVMCVMIAIMIMLIFFSLYSAKKPKEFNPIHFYTICFLISFIVYIPLIFDKGQISVYIVVVFHLEIIILVGLMNAWDYFIIGKKISPIPATIVIWALFAFYNLSLGIYFFKLIQLPIFTKILVITNYSLMFLYGYTLRSRETLIINQRNQ